MSSLQGLKENRHPRCLVGHDVIKILMCNWPYRSGVFSLEIYFMCTLKILFLANYCNHTLVEITNTPIHNNNNNTQNAAVAPRPSTTHPLVWAEQHKHTSVYNLPVPGLPP